MFDKGSGQEEGVLDVWEKQRKGLRWEVAFMSKKGRSWWSWSWRQGEGRQWSPSCRGLWPCEDFGCSLDAVGTVESLSTGMAVT